MDAHDAADPTAAPDAPDAALAREEASRRLTERTRAEQRDGAPVVDEDGPAPAPYHDPTPMAPGPSEG